MGRMKNAQGPDSIVFASESCAFDLLRAEFIRDVLPGELVMVSQDGVTSRQYASGMPQSSCVFEHVYFARPDSRIFGRWVQESRDEMGRQLARESGVPGRRHRSRARLRCHRRAWLRGRGGPSLPHGPHPQSLRRPHVYRTRTARPRLRRSPQAQPRAQSSRRQARHAH